jgi:hypothetical protein
MSREKSREIRGGNEEKTGKIRRGGKTRRERR